MIDQPWDVKTAWGGSDLIFQLATGSNQQDLIRNLVAAYQCCEQSWVFHDCVQTLVMLLLRTISEIVTLSAPEILATWWEIQIGNSSVAIITVSG